MELLHTVGWDETDWTGTSGDGVRTTVATVRATIEGVVTGDVEDRWLMSYAPDGTASFVGLSRVAGTVDGKAGTVVWQHVGRMSATGALHSDFVVAAGSGTGDLTGLTGGGTLDHPGAPGEPTVYTFDPLG